MKNSVNILFICGYGVGSSLMLKIVVEKALKELNVQCETQHTAVGESTGFAGWADIVAVSKKLVEMVDQDSFKGKPIVIIENLMDGKKIGKEIYDIVVKNFPGAINNG